MSYLAAVFVVGLVIAIHEYRHLLAAKWCGIPIEVYATIQDIGRLGLSILS